MHILVSAIGSSGDINPLLLVAARLKDEGHKVDFIASPHFEERVRRCGVNLLPLGTIADYENSINDPAVWQHQNAFAAVWRMTMQAAKMNYEIIESAYTPGDTLLLSSSLAIGGKLAQEKLGLPLVSIHLAPSLMLSTYDTPQSPTSPVPESFPRLIKSLWIKFFERLVLDPICCPPLNEIRAQLNLPEASHIITKWWHSPQLVICAFPDWFASVQPDWPLNTYTSNFPVFDAKGDVPLATELENFLQAGSAPIIITAGSAMAFAREFIENALAGARACKMRSVVVCSFDEQVPALDKDVIHVKYANFSALFRRAALALHHGGIGTSASAIAAGCPQLILPFAHDQFDNSLRLQRLGVARVLKNRKDMNEWEKALNYLRSQTAREKCTALKHRFESQPAGAEAIVEILKQKHMC